MITKVSNEVDSLSERLKKFNYVGVVKVASSAKAKKIDPIESFIEKAHMQIAKVNDLITGKEGIKLEPRGDWFIPEDDGTYRVKFSRNSISASDGTKWFHAKSLNEVVEILEIGVKLAEEDKTFQEKIVKVAEENAKKIAKGREITAAKKAAEEAAKG